MSEVVKLAGDTEKSKRYRVKFDRLAVMAESVFERTNRSKKEAEVYMQEHVDLYVALAQKDAKLVGAFTRVCDLRYPD